MKNKNLIYQLEGKPPFFVALPLGMQHVLAMFTGNLAPILIIIGVLNSTSIVISTQESISLIQSAMLASGIVTLLQLYPIKYKNIQIGANLPIVMGTTFAFVPTAISVANTYGFSAILASSLIGSIITIFIGFAYKYITKILSELVIGVVLIAIGINLLDVGVNYCAGGLAAKKMGTYGDIINLCLSFSTFAIIIAIQRFAKGIFKVSAILIGLVVGYFFAYMVGRVDTSIISEASWFSLPIPIILINEFHFELAPIVSAIIVYIITSLETIGNVNGITVAAFNRCAKEKEISGAILADGVGCMVASLLNALPNTAYGQNAGIIAMTKIINKYCIALGAFFIIVSAFIPKLGAVFRTIPDSVLGGAVIMIFAMILINGIKIVAYAGFSNKNVMILGITFGLGYGFGVHPEITSNLPGYISWVFKDSIVGVCVISMIASLIFAKDK